MPNGVFTVEVSDDAVQQRPFFKTVSREEIEEKKKKRCFWKLSRHHPGQQMFKASRTQLDLHGFLKLLQNFSPNPPKIIMLSLQFPLITSPWSFHQLAKLHQQTNFHLLSTADETFAFHICGDSRHSFNPSIWSHFDGRVCHLVSQKK